MSNKSAIVFGGQGSQYVGMGIEIYQSFSEARNVFNLASDILGYDIAQMCFNGDQFELRKTKYFQLCILTVELAINEVLKNIGVLFDAVAGYSLGEYAALVVAGSLNIRTAIQLVEARSTAMEFEVNDDIGKMVVVYKLDKNKIESICENIGTDYASIANYNSFNQVTVSVSKEVYDEFVNSIRDLNGRVIPLNVNRPFHHNMMKPAADKFKTDLNKVSFMKPLLPIYMNENGKPLCNENDLYDKLYKQIYKPVQWTETITNMINDGINCFYEISPKATLISFIENISKGKVNVIDAVDFINKGKR